MAKWKVDTFGGEIPLPDIRLLPDAQAGEAWNTDVTSGRLEGIPVLELVHDMTAVPGTVQRAYRIPGPTSTDPDVWLPLPSPYSSVVPSPMKNDSHHRVYWTNPDGGGAFWTTYERVRDGLPPYSMGFLPVEPYWVPVANAVGGTAPDVVPYVARSYLFTYVDEYGAESSPSVPSAVEEGASDAVWTVYGISNVPPTDFTGKNYPVVTKVRIYRTITGQSGAQFYQVTEIAIPPGVDPSVGWIDTFKDTDIVNNNTLPSSSYAPPLPNLDGLTLINGGMMVGFTGNTIHFSEPYLPHAWPAGYDLSLGYQIVALAAWSSTLVILTKGYPSTGAGNSPANFQLTDVQVPEPCIARGSVISDILGVYYSSPNGLIMLNYYGMQNETQQLISRKQWEIDFAGAQLIAARHRTQYVALNTVGTGFLIDFAETQRRGLVRLNTFDKAVCIWTDAYTADCLVMAQKKVYRWDSPNPGPMVWRWVSKRWVLPAPIELGACQVFLSADVEDPPTDAQPPLDNNDPDLVLPPDVNAIFRLYIDDNQMIQEKVLTERREIFRLPSGLKTHEWQFEIVSRVTVFRVELASTMKELVGA